MSRWHRCCNDDCDQLAYDYDECEDCREAKAQHRRKAQHVKDETDD